MHVIMISAIQCLLVFLRTLSSYLYTFSASDFVKRTKTIFRCTVKTSDRQKASCLFLSMYSMKAVPLSLSASVKT